VADRLARCRAARERGNTRLAEAHDQFWPSEAMMADGNPQLILERGEPVEKPPALIMQATNDDNLTADMARDFAAAYTKAGGKITFHEFEGVPHAVIARAIRPRPTPSGARPDRGFHSPPNRLEAALCRPCCRRRDLDRGRHAANPTGPAAVSKSAKTAG
jgi:hypothetical protein